MKIDQAATIKFSAGAATDVIMQELNTWQNENKTKRLWESDATLWTRSDEAKWTGWLNVTTEQSEIPRIEALAEEIKALEFTHLVLLGMGGSSLCPAMMAKTFGKIDRYPQLYILDSTDPMQIHHLEEKIDLTKTFFIVSSKSGSTLEPTIFKDYFYARLQTVLNRTDVGERFLAITDPGTKLEAIAKNENFKTIFYGVPSIGGRYSALSNFGMVPSGLMGIEIKKFLYHAEKMQKACAPEVDATENPGVILGVILGVCEKLGKNKITFIVAPEIIALGSWLEQLLAESTGKDGKGLIPIDQESLGIPAVYSQDRVFVHIRLETHPNAQQDHAINKLKEDGFVVITLCLPDKMHLGAELFRWEIATAVAGSIIGINPFNQPDVEESKVLALQLTTQYEKTQQFSTSPVLFSADGVTLSTDEKSSHLLKKQLIGPPSMAGYLQAYLNQIKTNDYVDLSAFIDMSEEHMTLLQESRILIRDEKRIATCLGFGPRFLHSTGQAYKGGPNTGVFLQIIADYNPDIHVPTHQYTFGLVIAAQAQADFNVLVKRDRRVLRIHLGKDVVGGLRWLYKQLQHTK